MERDKILQTAQAAFEIAYEALYRFVYGPESLPDIKTTASSDPLLQAAAPLAAEIYRNMNRLMIVKVKSEDRYHIQRVAERLKDMDVPPAIVVTQDFDFAVIDEATIIPDSALEALETIAERIKERKGAHFTPKPGEPLEIVLSKDTLWCPECKHNFLADVTMRENDPLPIHVATCPECDYIIGESEWNCIYSDPVIIHKMAEYERMLMETYCRMAHKHNNRIPIYTLLLNTASHPKGQGVMLHGAIVYPLEEHQMVIAVYKDSVEHIVMDGAGIELKSLSIDQILIYYKSIGFMLHDMSLLKPGNEEEGKDRDAIAARNKQRESVIEELREYEKGMIEGFALYNARQSRGGEEGSPRELFILVIDTPTAKIARWTRHPIAFPLDIDEFAIRIEKEGIERYSYDMRKMALEGMPVDQLRAYLYLAKGIVAAAASGKENGDKEQIGDVK